MALEPHIRPVSGRASVPIEFPETLFLIAARSSGPGRIETASLTDLSERNRRPEGVWNAPPGPWLLLVFQPVRGREELPNYPGFPF